MTDATSGPGAEGAPRDGKPRGRSAVPASVPGHEPTTGERTAGERLTDERLTDERLTGDRTAGDRTTGDRTTGDRTTGDWAPADAPAGTESKSGPGAAAGGPGTLAGRDGLRDDGLGGESPTGRGTAQGRDVPPSPDVVSGAPGTPGTPGTRGPSGTPAGHGPSGTSGDAAPLVAGSGQSRGGHGSEGPEGRDTDGSRLVPHDEFDKLTERLQHAVAGFVDEPKSAVQEADQVLEEVAARFADAVKERRRTLRDSWQSADGGGTAAKPATSGDTEQLRLALRDYRELTERLLHI